MNTTVDEKSTMEKAADITGRLSLIAWTTIGALASAIFYGMAISAYWGWFVVPLHVLQISIPQGIGLSAMVSLVTTAPPYLKDLKEKRVNAILFSIFFSLVMLAFGFIVHLFM